MDGEEWGKCRRPNTIVIDVGSQFIKTVGRGMSEDSNTCMFSNGGCQSLHTATNCITFAKAVLNRLSNGMGWWDRMMNDVYIAVLVCCARQVLIAPCRWLGGDDE